MGPSLFRCSIEKSGAYRPSTFRLARPVLFPLEIMNGPPPKRFPPRQRAIFSHWAMADRSIPLRDRLWVTHDQGFVVKMKRVRERFGRTGSVAIGEHHDQTAKRQIPVGVKDTVLPRGWFAQGEKWFAFRAKSLRKFRRHRRIIRCLAGAEINNQLVNLLGCERAKTLVQSL